MADTTNEEFHTGTVQMKVKRNRDIESDNEQKENQNHVLYNSNTGDSQTD